MLVNIIVA